MSGFKDLRSMNLLIKTHYEATDWWNFTREFYEITGRTKSK